MKLNIFLFVMAVTGGLGWAYMSDQRTLPHAVLKPAPAFEAKTFNGQPIALSDYEGQVVLIHFWATWCPPCIVEFPTLIKLAQSKPELTVLAIAVKDEKKKIDRFLAKNKITLPPDFIIALDPDHKISRTLYGTAKLPESYLLTANHDIDRKIVGAEENWNSKKWQKRVDYLLNTTQASE